MRPSMVYRIFLMLCALAAADTVPPCDRSLISGVKDDEIDWKQHESGSVYIACVNESRPIMYDSTRLFYNLNCYRDGWTGVSEEKERHRLAEASEPMNISCISNYCGISKKSQGVRKITTFVGSEKHVEISCENEKLELEQTIRVRGDKARCSPAGWKDEYNGSLYDNGAFGPFFACKKVSRCSTQGGYSRVEISDREVVEVSQEHITNGWLHRCTQSDNALTAITAHSKRYRVLLCASVSPVKEEWIGTVSLWSAADFGSVIATNDGRLDITCVDYCKVAGTATNVTWTDTVVHVSCKQPYDYLIYGGAKVIPRGATYCTLSKGWMSGSGSDESSHALLTDDTETTAQFDCSPDLPTTTTIAPTTTATTTTTAAPDPVADSTTAPNGMIAIILLLALFRSLFVSN